MRKTRQPSEPPDDLPLMNLRDFIAVAELGSIAGAADQLHRVPSAISRSIRELEKWFGLPLFERRPRGMLVGEYGRVVLARAHRIRSEIDEAADRLSRSSSRAGPSLKTAIASHLLSSRKLQLVIGLAANRNIAAAAAQLKITPAGASMALARLEEILGQPLFRKEMRGLMPTEPAGHLILCAKRVFAEQRHMLSEISFISGNQTGRVVIGAGPLSRILLVPRAVTTALAQCPGLQLTTVESPYFMLMQGLRSGDIDIVIGVLREDDRSQGIVHELLFENELCILAGAGHPLAKHGSLQLSALTSCRWVLPRRPTQARARTDHCFRECGLEPPVPSIETGDSVMIREILQASDLLAVTLRSQMLVEIENGSLVELPVKLAKTALDVELIVRDGAMLSPAAEILLDAIRSEARKRH